MRFKKGHWAIAYRESRNRNWMLVKNPRGGWAADPFLFKHNGKIFLFAEIMSYQAGKGYIGYCEWNGKSFGEWKTAIKEEWHLSYPDVFEWNGKVYMIPEQYQSGEIALYESVQFPSKWKRLSPLANDGEYVDSTVLFRDDRAWLFTLRMNPKKHSEGQLLRAELFSAERLGKFEVIDEVGGLYKRPGGNFVKNNERIYRAAQNCDGGYGSGLIFYLVERCDDTGYEEREEKRINPEAVVGKMDRKSEYIGIHTYNECGGMEVVDLKRLLFRMDESFYRMKRKINRAILKPENC